MTELQAGARRAAAALCCRWCCFAQGVSRGSVRQLPAAGCAWWRRPREAEDQSRHLSQPDARLQRESSCDWAHRLSRDVRRGQIRVRPRKRQVPRCRRRPSLWAGEAAAAASEPGRHLRFFCYCSLIRFQRDLVLHIDSFEILIYRCARSVFYVVIIAV